MKKIFLAAVLVLCAGFMLQAAGEFIQVSALEAEGCSVSYDWKLDKAEIKGKGGSAGIVLNYPYVTSDGKEYRIDSPPYIEEGRLYISAYTAGKIRRIISGGTAEKAETAPVKVIVRSEKRPEATAIPAPARETKKSEKEAEPAAGVEIRTAAEEPAASATRMPETVTAQENGSSGAPQKPSRKLIVLDPGHGGNDPGASGLNGLNEKDVVLSVAKRVKQYLKSYNADVLLTRDTDDFITLKNRAVFANSRKADVFVSIHCNASDNRHASGIRSYIYNRVASSKEAAEAAKFENKDAGAFEFLMNDLRKSAYEYLSIEAAGNIQQNLINALRLKWLPTERAPFYVIANTNMPSVLVEIAFISNPKEEEKLKSQEFKDNVAESISTGIKQYLAKVK